MDVDELDAVIDEMSDECGDQIDALYDTVTINKDTYDGFICRLQEISRCWRQAPVAPKRGVATALEAYEIETKGVAK